MILSLSVVIVLALKAIKFYGVSCYLSFIKYLLCIVSLEGHCIYLLQIRIVSRFKINLRAKKLFFIKSLIVLIKGIKSNSGKVFTLLGF